MFEELKLFEKEFKRIKKMGYVRSRRGVNSELNTFLSLLYNKDFLSTYNIKIKKDLTRKYDTLFKMSPKGESDEIKRLRNTYGECDPILKKAKTLFVDVQANCYTLGGTRFLFRLDVDYVEEKVYLVIIDHFKILHERKVFWSFKDLKRKLKISLQNIILVKVWTKSVNGVIYYKYYDYDVYQLKDFSAFLKLLEEGTIRISFRIGIYRTGAKTGKMKDNGTVFQIQELDLEKLYLLNKQ